MMKIAVNKRVKSRVPYQAIDKVILSIEKILKLKKNTKVSLAIVGSSEMKKLNKHYRKKDKPTDVLSFVDGEKEGKEINLGEIIICYPYLVKQSKEMGHSNDREFVILFIHGLLHLLGYDHIKAREAEKMRVLENKILDNI